MRKYILYICIYCKTEIKSKFKQRQIFERHNKIINLTKQKDPQNSFSFSRKSSIKLHRITSLKSQFSTCKESFTPNRLCSPPPTLFVLLFESLSSPHSISMSFVPGAIIPFLLLPLLTCSSLLRDFVRLVAFDIKLFNSSRN